MTDNAFSSLIVKLITVSTVLIICLASCSQPPVSTPTTVSTSTPTATRTAVAPTQATKESTSTSDPRITATPSPCVETSGTIHEEEIPSKLLKETINVKVYLPPCYSSNPDTQYSVLYMLHGQTSMNDQWVRLGLFTAMDDLLAKKLVKPFLIVLPNEYRSNAEAYDSKYGEALVEEVFPYIEEHYRVCTDRACRAIGGLSRGGNWAVHLGFEYPELFSAVGAHSAPLFYGEISNIIQIASNTDAAALPVFYIDVGTKDEDHSNVLLFLSTLQKWGVQREFHDFIGYHDENYWSNHVQDYLKWYNSHLNPPTKQ